MLFSFFYHLFTGKPLSPELIEIKKKLNSTNSLKLHKQTLSKVEREIINKINDETSLQNKNNVTRTMAYLHFYEQYSEIEWAFLAHMVSRNAGWNMTDLKGQYLPYLLTKKEQEDFFNFMERGNWLIFQDAYPQLLLYEESKRRNKNLFHLLPFLGVSIFMYVLWDHYWNTGNRYILTVGLIINEQNYIEGRVIQNKHYQQKVLEKMEFKLQDLLSLNQILFPYRDKGKINIAGQTVHQFGSLKDRIALGKDLYGLLFFHDLHKKILDWATVHPHSGSRNDFWPHLFHTIREDSPANIYKPKIKNCTLKDGVTRVYSPILEDVWKDRRHTKPEEGDWYTTSNIVHLLKKEKQKNEEDIKEQYCETLNSLELVVTAKEFLRENK